MLITADQRQINHNSFLPQSRSGLQRLFGSRPSVLAVAPPQTITGIANFSNPAISVTMDAPTVTPGAILRFYACGTMVNSVGGIPLFGIRVFNTTILSTALSFGSYSSNTLPIGWVCQAEFFVTTSVQQGFQATPIQSALPQVGTPSLVQPTPQALAFGATIRATISEPNASSGNAFAAQVDPQASVMGTNVTTAGFYTLGQPLPVLLFAGSNNSNTVVNVTYASVEGV